MKQRWNCWFFIKTGILMLIGTVLAVLIRMNMPVSPLVLIADILFAQASMVLMFGIWLTCLNAHVFTSLTYGFRSLHKLMQGRPMKGKAMKDDYLKYRETRKHHDDAPQLLIIGAVWLAVATIVSLLA